MSGEKSTDWKRVEDLNPKGFAAWSTPLGVTHFYGPVKSLTVDDLNQVFISFEWIASKPGVCQDDEHWEKVDKTRWSQEFDGNTDPYILKESEEKGPYITFATVTLYINEVSALDPSKVKGLK